MNIISAYVITFIASFCMLVIEIVAGPILAPYVGVSLLTWTSIIGIVMAEAALAPILAVGWPTGSLIQNTGMDPSHIGNGCSSDLTGKQPDCRI